MIPAAITRLLDWLGNRIDIELDRLTDLGGEDE